MRFRIVFFSFYVVGVAVGMLYFKFHKCFFRKDFMDLASSIPKHHISTCLFNHILTKESIGCKNNFFIFRDSFNNFFGENLESVSNKVEFNPEVGTYESRSLGGTHCPGVLLSSFSLTL